MGIPLDTQCYEAGIAALVAASRWKEALFVIDAMVQDGHIPDHQLVSSVLLCMIGQGRHTESILYLRRMRQAGVIRHDDIGPYYGVMSLGIRKGIWEQALVMLREISTSRVQGWVPIGAVHTILYQLALQGKNEEAVEVLHMQRAHPWAPAPDAKTYNLVIKACAWGGDVAQAEAIVALMQEDGCPPDFFSFKHLLEGYQKGGDWQRAGDVLRRMEEAGIKADTNIYGMVVKVYGKAARWREAIKALKSMKAQGIAADEMLYGIVIHACARNGQPEPAMALLREMERTLGIRANVIVYSSVMHAYAKANDHSGALSVLDLMASAGVAPNQHSYNTAINACTRSGSHQEALHLFEEMRHKGLAPDKFSYSGAIKAHAFSGNLEAIPPLLKELLSLQLEPQDQVLHSAIVACATFKTPQIALDILHTFHDLQTPVPPILYSSLVDMVGRLETFEDTLKLFKVNQQRGLMWTPDNYVTLIGACRSTGDWLRALYLFEEATLQEAGARMALLAHMTLEVLKTTPGADALWTHQVVETAVAEGAFKSLNHGGQPSVLDLHYVTSTAAIAILRVVISRYQQQPSLESGEVFVPCSSILVDPHKDLVVIIGKGTNSKKERPVLPAVIAQFLEQKLRPPVKGDLDPANHGRLVIPAPALRESVFL